MSDRTDDLRKSTVLRGEDIDWLLLHQANRRIIDAVVKRLAFDPAKVVINLDRYGNTVAGTIPIGLGELNDHGRLKYGDRVVLTAFGAGYTSGAIYLRWAVR